MDPRHAGVQLQEVAADVSCPLCGTDEVRTMWKRHVFDYGSGGSVAELSVDVPVRSCASCELEFLDEPAEVLKHEAICRHLGVLTPAEIRRTREDHGMSRVAFAQVTGLGEASLNRWENGLNIQTHANDRYLRLLRHPGIMRELQAMTEPQASPRPAVAVARARFRVLEVNSVVRKEQESFRLRNAA